MTETQLDQHIQATRRELGRHTWGASRVEGALHDLALSKVRHDARRRRAVAVGSAFAVAAASTLAVAGWQMFRSDTSPAALATSADASGLERIRLDDGSEVRFERTAKVEVRERSNSLVVVALGAGTGHFRVRHDAGRRFRVRAGEVEVEDLGTTFDVENKGSAVRVLVTDGSVMVSFPRATGVGRESVNLRAGESGIYPALAPAGAPGIATATPAAQPEASSVSPVSPARSSNGPSTPGWRELARSGKHGSAYELLAPGGFRDVRDEPGDLLLASDAARLSHHPAEATTLLRKVLATHARDPRAPSAAFTLGWLLMNELGRPREAAVAFARAESLAPRGNLAEDAAARSVEAWHRAGDGSRAKAEVERYRRSYPQGRHLAMLERLVAKP